LLEKGFEVLVERELLPNLSKIEFEETMAELKLKHNYDESEININKINKTLDSITFDLLSEVDLSSSEDGLP